MKIFANKKIGQKILIIIGILVLISVIFPKPVAASNLGGALMGVIMSFFVGIADGVITIVHKVFVDQDVAIYVISEGIKLIPIALGILAAIVLVATGILPIGTIILGAALGVTLILANGGKTSVTFQTVSGITADLFADETMSLPDITLSPYEIFTDENGIFSVNFFTSQKDEDIVDAEHEKGTIVTTLRQNIADWYATLRLIAVVGMMSVLVYIGIRTVLSSTAESKAKYKQMTVDWLIAMVLIFVMHYIMVGSNIVVDNVTDTLGSIKVRVYETTDTTNKKGKAVKVTKQGAEGFLIGAKTGENGNAEIDDDTKDLVESAYKRLVEYYEEDEDGNQSDKKRQEDFSQYFWSDLNGTPATSKDDAKVLFWPADNFLSQARMNAQIVKSTDGIDSYDYIGYSLIYVALVIFTCIFIFVYLRRFIYMVFLTLISPLVALTYPIDKVKDGQAQAFNFWFREYIFNLLLQPLHLLIYMILIGSAMKFASNNPIYVIVCLGFMVPAEKLLKQMFGFKGSTPGSIPGLATGAFLIHATRRLFDKGPKGGKLPKGEDGKDSSDASTPVKQMSVGDYEEDNSLFTSLNDSNGSSGSSPSTVTSGNSGSRASTSTAAGTENGPITLTGPVTIAGSLELTGDELDKDIFARMREADMENIMSQGRFATDDERQMFEAEQREANNVVPMEYDEDEMRQILTESGYEGNEIDTELRRLGYGNNNGGQITLTGPSTITGAVQSTGPNTMEGDIQATGPNTINGPIEATGELNASERTTETESLDSTTMVRTVTESADEATETAHEHDLSTISTRPSNRRVGRLGALKNATIKGVKTNWNTSVGTKDAWKRNVKKAARVATGLAGAATFATAGGIAGMVTGDAGKAAEYAAMAGVGGYNLTAGLGDRAGARMQDFNKSVEGEYYKGREEERKQKEMDEYIKNWKKQDKNMDLLQRNLNMNNEQFKDYQATGAIDDYIRHGFYDAKDMVASEKFMEKYRVDRNSAMTALKMHKDIAGGDYAKLNSAEQEKWKNSMSKKFMKQLGTNDANDQRVKDSVSQAEKYLTDISKIKSKIQ